MIWSFLSRFPLGALTPRRQGSGAPVRDQHAQAAARTAESVGLGALILERLRRRRRRRPPAWQLGVTGLCLVLAPLARATTVVPPTFAELVAEADSIVRATVVSIESRRVPAVDGPTVKTFVELKVRKRLKGTPPDTFTLEFLGGTVGDESLRVIGMPHFVVGETEIVFVHGNGVQFCPVVRLGHGRYRVRHDAANGRDFVAREDETPLGSVSDVQLPVDTHGVGPLFRAAADALTPEQFETEIAREVTRRGR